MKKAVILSASPKKSESQASAFLAAQAQERLNAAGVQADVIDVGAVLKNPAPAYEAMRAADALLIVFPLYFFCLPGMLMRFLEDYAALPDKTAAAQQVYAVVNCGFPEPGINEEAIRVVKSFARHIGAAFGFGVGFGGGGMLIGQRHTPMVQKPMNTFLRAIDLMADRILENRRMDGACVYIQVKFPRMLYFLAGNLGWRLWGRQNGLKKRELYRQPYRAELS